jgi:hypothetical protein
MTITRSVLLLAMAQALTGCGSSHPLVGPSSIPPATPPLRVNQVTGYVSDTAFRALAGVRVAVLDGPQAGLAATSDAAGRFSLSGEFDDATRFQATRDDLPGATLTLAQRCPTCTGPRFLYFRLAVFDRPANVAGDYMLTFTADAACTSLPAEARTRSYAATIAATPDPIVPAGTLLRVVITGAPVVPGNDGFTIGVAGNFVNLEVWNGEGPGVVERLAPKTYVGLFGYAGTTVTSSDAPITAAFDGTIEYCVATFDGDPSYGCTSVQTDRRDHCASKNHRITLTRR